MGIYSTIISALKPCGLFFVLKQRTKVQDLRNFPIHWYNAESSTIQALKDDSLQYIVIEKKQRYFLNQCSSRIAYAIILAPWMPRKTSKVGQDILVDVGISFHEMDAVHQLIKVHKPKLFSVRGLCEGCPK